jgi:hypothetical protein
MEKKYPEKCGKWYTNTVWADIYQETVKKRGNREMITVGPRIWWEKNENGGKWEMHIVGPGIWREHRITWKMRHKHCMTWNMARNS